MWERAQVSFLAYVRLMHSSGAWALAFGPMSPRAMMLESGNILSS